MVKVVFVFSRYVSNKWRDRVGTYHGSRSSVGDITHVVSCVFQLTWYLLYMQLQRQGDRHDFIQLTAQILLSVSTSASSHVYICDRPDLMPFLYAPLQGEMDSAFKKADNSKIVATDTVRRPQCFLSPVCVFLKNDGIYIINLFFGSLSVVILT